MTELQINKDFVLRKVCGVNVVLPAGLKVKDFGGALNLNDTAALIFLASVQKTIDSLREAGVVS